MSYFLKKTKNNKGTYLQIYESYYDPARKTGAHRSYKPLGYVHELQANGIEDPITFYSEEIEKLNQDSKQQKQSEKARQISEESPEKFLGYFPFKISWILLDAKDTSTFCKRQRISDFQYSI